MKITLEPAVLRWARERASLSKAELTKKLGVRPERVAEWEQNGALTIHQAEKLARTTHTPYGYLYLDEPPEEQLPVPDFRTLGDRSVKRLSPDLIETVQLMQQRQAWMRDWLIEDGAEPLSFVGSFTLHGEVKDVAGDMRAVLGIEDDWARHQRTWQDALRHLRQRIEDTGILITINGVVGNNTHRKLNPDEFRGFVFCDEYAPLIFINGADFTAAQMFTMAHELAHVWIGQGGVSNLDALEPAPVDVERFCNKVAAEFLVPSEAVQSAWDKVRESDNSFQLLARRFKVSTIVAARRVLDLKLISKQVFFDFYHAYEEDEQRMQALKKERGKGGGDFWNTQNVRIGHRFGTSVVRAVLEGRIPYTEAYWLTGLRGKPFDSFANQIGYRVW